MTGAIQANAVVAQRSAIIVTTGTPGGSTFGFANGVYGSASPGSVRGKTIQSIISSTGVFQIQIGTSGSGVNIPRGLFQYLAVQTDGGSTLILPTSSVSLFSEGNVSSWQWSVTAPWASASASRSVVIN